jgi:hypothetical protein
VEKPQEGGEQDFDAVVVPKFTGKAVSILLNSLFLQKPYLLL